MATVSLPGTTNTVYVTTPDTITVTPSNINSFLSSSFTPKITTKNAPASTHTKYFLFELQRQGLNYRDLIIYSAKFTKGSKTATNITAYTGTYGCGSSVKLGIIAQDKISGKTYNLIRVTEHETIGDVGEMSSGYAAVTINFNSFNPTVTISKSSTSTINSQFGLVKGFFKSTFNATALSSWSYTGGTIAPNTTLKTTAAGVEGNTSTGTGSRSSSVTTGIISGTSVTGTATATNTLGGSTTKTLTETAQNYTAPQLSNVKVDRSGTNAVITLDWSVAEVNRSSTAQTSPVTSGAVTVSWSAVDNVSGTQTTWTGSETIVANGSALTNIGGSLTITDSTHIYDTETSYTFTITLTDRLGESKTITVILPTEFYTIDFKAGGRGVAIGKAAAKDAFECSMDPFFTTWIGIVQMFAGKTPPNGWLLCDGSSQLISDYPELAAALYDSSTSSYIYGSADSTHFNLPDLRGRFPIGVGNGTATGHTAHTLNQKGGNENAIVPYHRHGIPQLTTLGGTAHHHSGPSHSHKTGSGTHFQYYDSDVSGANQGRRAVGSGGSYYAWTTAKTAALLASTNTASAGTGNTGDESAHTHTISATNTNYEPSSDNKTGANMPPFIGINFIIYAGTETV